MRGQLDREHTGPCRQRSPAAGRFAKETFPAAKNGSDELRGHIIQPRAKAWPALISNAFHNRRTSDFARYKGPKGSNILRRSTQCSIRPQTGQGRPTGPRLPRRRRGQRISTSADVVTAVCTLARVARDGDDIIAAVLNRRFRRAD